MTWYQSDYINIKLYIMTFHAYDIICPKWKHEDKVNIINK
jgi:hypothetical protein